ncbi:hypothetical protein L596_001656 [Steinernema carpocapsae]|uniref:Uncharacterized protein n=1 Tax=Steinernema carpocapsae TaxID=34508 RepID=A0A4V6I7G8_STECR|nr:hypothetical protein L596_001656 [Steinernema carpocapsae]
MHCRAWNKPLRAGKHATLPPPVNVTAKGGRKGLSQSKTVSANLKSKYGSSPFEHHIGPFPGKHSQRMATP